MKYTYKSFVSNKIPSYTLCIINKKLYFKGAKRYHSKTDRYVLCGKNKEELLINKQTSILARVERKEPWKQPQKI